jgi:pyridoxine 5-phosphate synthase
MPLLGVNIDHVATLREARREGILDIVPAAEEARLGGADSITVHLREDRRHINDQDMRELTSWRKVPINMEMAVAEEVVLIAEKILPDSACLVPEKRQELTTEGGLDVAGGFERVSETVRRLQDRGVRVSLFIDPDIRQVDAAAASKADSVEIHTGAYSNADRQGRDTAEELLKIREAAKSASEAGLSVHAGHGLDYSNIAPLLKSGIFREYNIGYSIICRAVFAGLRAAVSEMKVLVDCGETEGD